MAEDTPPTMRGLDDQEESVRIAVKALGDMRNMNTNSHTRAASYSQSQFEPQSQSHNTKLPPIILPPLSTSKSPSNNNSFSSSVATTSAAASTSTTPAVVEATANSPAFVSRMSHFPLVNSALRVYEQGKASSRVVKYGAEMVESSVKSISRPVIDRLPVNVNQLDEFACRQLDRLDKYRRPSTSGDNPSSPADTVTNTNANSNAPSPADRDRGRPKLRTKTLDGSAVIDDDDGEIPDRDRRERGSGGGRSVPKWLEATSPFVAPPPPPPDLSSYGYSSPRSYSRSSTPTRDGESERARSSFSYPNDTNPSSNGTGNSSTTASNNGNGSGRQVAQRSRWQAVLLEAGGLSAALSEESMRRLKYCLQWLQYATAHIDAQILILRDFTASLQTSSSSSSTATPPCPRPPISEEHMRKLTDVRRDIVHTIRQVVDVVSKYAGGALPEPARGRVRGFILKLPQRWASRAGGNAGDASSNAGEGDREREVVTAAAGSGTGVVRRAGGQRRAAQRERGVDSSSASVSGSGMRSGASSAAVSPSSSPRVGRAVLAAASGNAGGHGGYGGGQTVSATTALAASQRILTLATESLDMMRNVTGVVKDSLDRADAWVGRLRTVGIQRGVQDGDADVEANGAPSDSATNASAREREAFEFEFSDRMRYRQNHSYNHSRKGSTQSDSVQSIEMEVDMDRLKDRNERDADVDADGIRSPFFSAASSTAWGSSIPSTPGVGAPANLANLPNSGSRSGGLSRRGSALSVSASPGVHSPSPSINGLPIGIGIGAMSLGSKYGTPKSGVVGLPEEEVVEEGDVLGNLKGDLKGSGYVTVKVVGEDVKREVKAIGLREEEEEGMDIDDADL